MCNPCSLLPCCQQPGQFSAQNFGVNDTEAQGIDDFFKNLCETLGCRERQSRNEPTLLAHIHKHVLDSARRSWPEADAKQCLAPAIEGIINGVGQAFAACPNGQAAFLQSLLTNVAPHVGALLSCIFGPERAVQVEAHVYRYAGKQAVDWISCLIPILTALCQQQCPTPQPPQPPPQPPNQSPCCPPGPGPGQPGTLPQPNQENRC